MRRKGLSIAALASFWLATGCQAAGTADPTATLAIPDAPTATAVPTETANPTPTMAVTPETEEAADADVEYVRAVQMADGSWTFHVTVSHPDTGWEDYADGWDVITLDGAVLKSSPEDPFTRLLLHPHENEQPFTRSQSGIVIPDGISQLVVRAHDLVDGFGGREVAVDLTAESGQDFEVSRQ